MENMTELKVIRSEAPQERVQTIMNAAGAICLIPGILFFILSFGMLAIAGSFWFAFEIVMSIILLLCVAACYGIKQALVNWIKKTELIVTERAVFSYYVGDNGIAKKTFDVPIEQIQGVFVTGGSSSQSKGRTIRMQTGKRKLLIRYVLNADEVVTFLETAIQKVKEQPYEQQDATSYAAFLEAAIQQAKERSVEQDTLSYEKQDIRPQRSQSDIADSLKKIADLRDAGIITEEEFEQKKKEILGKM